LIRGEVAGVLF